LRRRTLEGSFLSHFAGLDLPSVDKIIGDADHSALIKGVCPSSAVVQAYFASENHKENALYKSVKAQDLSNRAYYKVIILQRAFLRNQTFP
jgi:hypothetical protein